MVLKFRISVGFVSVYDQILSVQEIMTPNDSCYLNESNTVVEGLNFFVFNIAAPTYFLFGISTRGICLIAFYKQYKKENAYGYQMFSAFCDMLAVITIFLCNLTIDNLAGFRLPGSLGFQQNYALMWYSARLAAPLDQASITAMMLALLSMSADRLLAMTRPFLYKTINHKRHQALAAFFCLFVGFSTSAFDMFRYDIRQNGDRYKIVIDYDYVATPTAAALAMVRNVTRVVGNVALVACNVIMVITYRMSVRKTGVVSDNDERLARRKRTERTLLALTLCQSIYSTVSMCIWNVYFGLAYNNPSFTSCTGKLMAPASHLVEQVGEIVQFFVMYAVSKQFRATIIDCLRCKEVEGS